MEVQRVAFLTQIHIPNCYIQYKYSNTDTILADNKIYHQDDPHPPLSLESKLSAKLLIPSRRHRHRHWRSQGLKRESLSRYRWKRVLLRRGKMIAIGRSERLWELLWHWDLTRSRGSSDSSRNGVEHVMGILRREVAPPVGGRSDGG